MGRSLYVLRLQLSEDRYGDSQGAAIISNDYIEAIIDYPAGIPLFTDRNLEVSSIGSYVYDVLPIEGYFRFQDNVVPDDIIVSRFFDQNDEGFIQVFRVAELIGNIGVGVLSMQYNLAPYNSFLDEYPNIKTEIETYESEAFL